MKDGYLRLAEMEDMDLIFIWANEEMVRKNSFSTRKITYEEHVIWYRNMLKNNQCRQYIFMCGDQPVGQARITVQGNVAEIGYSICAAQRSKGYGKQLLVLISKQAWNDFPNINKVIGRVKTDNIASQKVFLAAGYEEAYRVYEIEKRNI